MNSLLDRHLGLARADSIAGTDRQRADSCPAHTRWQDAALVESLQAQRLEQLVLSICSATSTGADGWSCVEVLIREAEAALLSSLGAWK